MSFLLYADKNQLDVWQRVPVTSGSVNVYPVQFKFSCDWDGMTKTACFRCGTRTISVLLDDTGKCAVPWEVMGLDCKGKKLLAGVYGSQNGDVVLPTIWVSLGDVLEGVTCGQNARPPVPSLWEQQLDQKQDKLTGRPGQIIGFGEDGQPTAQDPAAGGVWPEIATDQEVTEMLDEVFLSSQINE